MTFANAYFSGRLGQAGNNSQIGSLKALIVFRPSSFSQAVFFFVSHIVFLLINCQLVYAGTHADGDSPTGGRSFYVTTESGTVTSCSNAGCHTDIPSNGYPDLAAIANSPSTLINLANANASMSAANRTRANSRKEDLSAYFASTLSPQVNTPPNRTLNPGDSYNQAITAPINSDFLVSTTRYEVTAGALPTGISITGSPGVAAAFSGSIPSNNTTDRGAFSVTFRARNTNAGTSATVNGATRTFTITVRAAQIINFGAIPTVRFNGTGLVTATGGGSGNPVTFTSQTPTQCTVTTGGTVTGLVVGANNCRIAANQASNLAANYVAANEVTQTISIQKANQTTTFGVTPSVSVGTTGTVSATATSGLTVSFSSTTPSTCSVAGTTVTGIAAGTCTVAANQAGNANFNAATQVTQNITVARGNQSINFGATPSVTVGTTGTVSATATSGLTVSFISNTPSTCNVAGSTVTGLAVGTCEVGAIQSGNANFNAAPETVQNINIGAGSQTISFGAAPAVVVNGTGTLSATSTSGLAVSFSSTTPSTCSVAGTTVTGIAAGTCTVAANQAGNANFNAATQVTQNITVARGNQSINFGATPSVTVGTTGTVSATATSGLTVSFSSTTPSTCSVAGTTVTGIAAGTCTVAANQAGNANFNAATQVTQNITVARGNQSINFGATPSVTVGTTGTVSATATSGLTVSFISNTPSTCNVAGSTVTGLAVGTCEVGAIQSGNANFNAAPETVQNINIGAGSQTISFGAAPAVVVNGTGTLSATSTSGLAVSFSSTTPSTCSVAGTTVTGIAAGTCTVAANQAGNANFNAATQVTQNITVARGNQSINFGATPSVTVGTTGTVSATATSGLTVSFSSTTPSTCSVAGTTVTGIAAGTCTVAANQAGNANFNAATQVTQNITVARGSQTISFGPPPSVAVGTTGTVSATATSGLAVSFSSTTPSTCSVAGTTVTGIVAGICTVAANQAGNANFNAAAQVILSFGVGASTQTISFGPPPSVSVGTTGTVSATATSGLAVSFSSTTPSTCSVAGTTVTGIAAGTCTVAANQAGNASFSAAPQVTQNINIGAGSQTISFGPPPSVAVGTTGTVSATATSGLAVSFSSTTPSTCSVAGTTVTGIAAGICTVAANQAGNANFNAATQATQNINIGAGSQTISFGPPPSVAVGTTGTVSATATSGLAVSFSSTTPSTCSVAGTTVTGIAAGICTVAANQAGNANFNAATQATQNINIGAGSQTISFGPPPSVAVGTTGTVSATATSGLAVSFSSTTPSTCSVAGTTVTGIAAGICTVAANQAGNANFNAATQATQNINIGAGSQTISFGPPPSVSVGTTGTVSALGGLSGNPVLFSSLTTGVCTVLGNIVTGVASGTCMVAANQAGNANFNAAAQVILSFGVGASTQTISFGPPPSVSVVTTGTVIATATSGLAVSFSSTTPSTCSVAGTTVTGIAAGTCTIAANQAGNASFSAAPQVTQNINIGAGSQAISFGPPPSVAVGTTGTVSATATSGLAVSFSSTTPSTCSVAGTTVTGIAAGICTVAANQAGNANFNAATQATQNINIGAGSQTISFGPPPSVAVGTTGTVSATATSGLAVSFSSTTPSTCSVAGTTVTGIVAGICTVAANQAGNANFNAATQATQNINIGAGSQTISFGPPPSVAVGTTGTVSATATSGLAVSFSSTTPSTCSVAGTTVTGIVAGICTVAANQAGNASFSAAPQVLQSFGIDQADQTISFGVAPNIVEGGTGVVTAIASSGLAVSLTIPNTTSVCSISGNTVTALAVGVCTVAADQAGSANFAAAPQQTQDINIGAAPVTASAVSIDVPLNTPTTVNLAAFIAGSAVTGVKLVSLPTGGTATTNGTNITYVPKNNFFGKDSLSYVAFGTTGESAPAVITVNIIGRPDPTQDQNVRNLVSNQLATAQRFNRAQSLNFQQRLETLHGRIGNRGNQSNTEVATNEPKGSTLGDVEARSIGLRIQDNQQKEKASLIANSPQGITQSTQQATTQQANTPPATGNLPNNTFSSSNAMMADARPLTDGEALAGLLNGSVGNTLIETLRSKSINLAALSGAINNGLAKNDPDAVEIWMAGNVRVGSVEQEGFNFSNYNTDGITVGLDKPFGDHLILGLGLSYARDTSELASDGSKAMAKGLSLSVYGSYQAAENTYIDAMVGYGKIDYESKRFVSSVGAFAEANRDGDQFFASIAGAYEYKNQGYMLSPYARLDLSYNRLDRTTESGAGLNALRYGDSKARFAQVSAGFRAEANHQADFGIITPRVRLEYQASTQSNDDTNIQYADQLGGNFRLAGTTNRQGSIVFGLGSDILMKNGIRLGLDYQSLRSPGTESSQALSFRLAKDLGVTDNKLPILDTESLALPKLGIRLDMGYTYDDNVNRARENDEKLQDRVYSFNLNKGKNFSINANSRIVLNGFFGAEKSYYFRGLDKVSLGAQGEYQYRTSGAFSAPTYGVFTRLSTEQFNSELRDSVRISSGFTFRKPITDKLSTFAALAYNKRNASSEVFDLDEISLRANFDYQTFSDSTLYFTGELRHGDIVSTARPSLENLDGSDANVLDDVFKQQGYASYRFKGNTALATFGYNLPIGPTDGLDFSWRWVKSTPSDVPNYVNDKRSYYDNQFSIVYLVRF